MKRLLFLLWLASLSSLHGQVFRATIVDCATQEPMPFASVYLEGTYKGVTTDLNGYFELAIDEAYRGMPIIFSSIGYFSGTLDQYQLDQAPIKLCLEERVYELSQAVVRLDTVPRSDKLAYFLREFLGWSGNAKDCELQNPDDLVLWFDGPKLRGFAKQPLQIHNRALGYFIEYDLDEFQSDLRSRTQYYGHYRFLEDSTSIKKEQRRIKRKRKQAYFGSRMHFIRTLHRNSLYRDNYQLLNKDKSAINRTQILTYEDGFLYLEPQDLVQVRYLGKNVNEYTGIRIRERTLILSNGFYDAKSMQWLGTMSDRRVADLLPFEYDPTHE